MVDKQRTLPELLAPAGDMERLKMAVLYGADAVYLAGTDFGMRAFAGNFDPDELKAAVAYAHAHNVRVHCTINTMPRGDEIVRLPAHLERLNDAGVDAVIVADLGAFTLAGKYAPNCQRHISTQASISNYVTANAWYDLGASRVILARELSLEEIRTIRENTPAELEIEAFVHGAMCVSYSGRCLLSNYMTGRDASRGACAQPCRYHYALMEEKRPGEYFPIEEDEKGSYILNSRDMCMIDHLDDLLDVGLSSLKIEGRAKSAYYAAIVTGAYRHCLDDAAAGRLLQCRLSARRDDFFGVGQGAVKVQRQNSILHGYSPGMQICVYCTLKWGIMQASCLFLWGCARRRVSERNRRRRLLARRLKVAPQGRMRGKPFNTAILISVYPRFGGVFVLRQIM